VCWKPCSSCWSFYLLREEFLSAPIHSPLSGSPYRSFSSTTPPSSAAPNSRDPCARSLLARRRCHMGPGSPGLHLHRSLLHRRSIASASEHADAALYAVHAGGERRLPESCMGGPSRGGAGEWRAAPVLVMGAATTPEG
jgi:hypothetical protein